MRPEPPVAGAVGSSRTAPAWRKPMYPPNLDAFHQIYLDRSQRAIADAEAHRHATLDPPTSPRLVGARPRGTQADRGSRPYPRAAACQHRRRVTSPRPPLHAVAATASRGGRHSTPKE
jgi:hypothetical protein